MRTEVGRRWVMHDGDCLDVMREWLAACDGPRFDHVITDPPYEAECHTKARTVRDGNGVKAHAIPFAAITEDQRAECGRLFSELSRRWVLAFCQIEAIAKWRASFEAASLDWIRGMVWVKPDSAPQFTGDRPAAGHECMALAHHKGRKRWNGGGKRGVYTHNLEHRRALGGHATPKPVALMLDLIADFTDPGDTVLDPFAGSATTGIACLRLGREFVGIEKDENSYTYAVERLRAEEIGLSVEARRCGQVSLFEGGIR